MNSLKRGAFVVFEGCDRSGKTTQIERLVNRLNTNGTPARKMRFPERTTGIGSLINQYLSCNKDLDDHVVHLLFSANRWEMVDEIKKNLDEGTTIIVDRYAYSGVAFSAAKDGLELDWCKQPDVGLPCPDLVCFLDVSEEVAKARSDFGEERYEKTEFQAKVRDNYDLLSDSTWKLIDADQTMDNVHEAIYKIIEEEISRPKGVVGKLWSKDDDGESGFSSCNSQASD